MRKSVRQAKRAPGPSGAARPHAPALEWLWDAAGNGARAVVTGGRRALIENHTGILEFSPERIRLAARDGEITVLGAQLQLAEVRPRSLIVLGRIDAVTLPGEGADAHA